MTSVGAHGRTDAHGKSNYSSEGLGILQRFLSLLVFVFELCRRIPRIIQFYYSVDYLIDYLIYYSNDYSIDYSNDYSNVCYEFKNRFSLHAIKVTLNTKYLQNILL